jgi:hypothetical protein
MPFSKVKSPELASCFNCEADPDGSGWFESGYPTGRASSIACSSSTTTLLTMPDDDFTKP